jgi:hypothetical protein
MTSEEHEAILSDLEDSGVDRLRPGDLEDHRLSDALDAFCCAFGDGITWREVLPIVARLERELTDQQVQELREALEVCKQACEEIRIRRRGASHVKG